MGVRFSSPPTDKVHNIKPSTENTDTQTEDIEFLDDEKDTSTQTDEKDNSTQADEKDNSTQVEEKEPISYSTQKTDNQTILLNQAYCHTCHTIVKWCGTCTCRNVEVFGGDDELGRKIKHPNLFSDCNLIEYKGSLPNTPTNSTVPIMETNPVTVHQEAQDVPIRKQSKKKYNTRYQSKS